MTAPDRDAERLLALLGIERGLLTGGSLDRLPGIEAAKAAALARLSARAGRTDPAMLRRLRARARENQRLFEAALAGIAHVQAQLAALVRGGGAELRTYGSDGGRRALVAGQGKLEHKA